MKNHARNYQVKTLTLSPVMTIDDRWVQIELRVLPPFSVTAMTARSRTVRDDHGPCTRREPFVLG
jgi:hypothetical protein